MVSNIGVVICFIVHMRVCACMCVHPRVSIRRLTGQVCVTWDIKKVLDCVGGIQVLIVLLELNQLPVAAYRESSKGMPSNARPSNASIQSAPVEDDPIFLVCLS